MSKVKVGVLGSTGSVGEQVLNVLDMHSNMFQIELLACKSSTTKIYEQKEKYNVNTIFIDDMESLASSETYRHCDIVINAISDIDGLLPTIAVLESDAKLITANKESLILFGHQILSIAKRKNKEILPIDTEHSAILQCIEPKNKINRLLLTASGGAFRDYSKEEIKKMSFSQALMHPVWKMGWKITLDSATLMNKGFEMIEARHLFGTKNIEVLIHYQSIVHSIVEYEDSIQKCVLSLPNVELAIQYALSHPRRFRYKGKFLDLSEIGNLSFEKPDYSRFPCLSIAEKVLLMDTDLSSAIMSLSNSHALSLFAKNKINFYDISDIILDSLMQFNVGCLSEVRHINQLDKEIKKYLNSKWK